MQVLLTAKTAADDVYVLQKAAKILAELQVISPDWRLCQAAAPWKLRLQGNNVDLNYVKNQICDIIDGRRATLLIEELP